MSIGILLASVPEGRMFGLDQQTLVQIVAQLINVGILAFFLVKFLYKPVQNALRKRSERVQGQLTEAEGEMSKAAALKLQYEQKIEEIQAERDEILSEARRLASETSQRLISEAKKEAETLKDRASANVSLEWERAEADMRTAIIEISSIMAEKMVTLAMNKETQDKLFDETMADLEGITWRS